MEDQILEMGLIRAFVSTLSAEQTQIHFQIKNNWNSWHRFNVSCWDKGRLLISGID